MCDETHSQKLSPSLPKRLHNFENNNPMLKLWVSCRITPKNHFHPCLVLFWFFFSCRDFFLFSIYQIELNSVQPYRTHFFRNNLHLNLIFVVFNDAPRLKMLNNCWLEYKLQFNLSHYWFLVYVLKPMRVCTSFVQVWQFRLSSVSSSLENKKWLRSGVCLSYVYFFFISLAPFAWSRILLIYVQFFATVF